MTHEQFIEWIDEEIKKCEYGKNHFDWASHNISLIVFREVREKFLNLTPPPTTLS